MVESRSRKVTSFDVARHAGVSRAAVSRSFTPDASVSAEMREKVHKAAKELGYRVNYLARSLTNQRSDLVGVVAAGLDNPFRSLQIECIARALLTRNFRPVLLPTLGGAETSTVIGQLLQYSVSGVIVTSDAPPSSLCEECAAHGVPIVLINKGDEIPLVDRVVSDDEAAGRLAAAHLMGAGARRPAVMAAPNVSYTARRRVEAFIGQCRAMGAEAELLSIELNDYAHGYAGAGQLRRERSDGVFCVNDYLACGLLDRLREEPELHPEGNVLVIGHDDIPQAAWASYRLTTIQQPADLQAKQAIDLLISRISQPEAPARLELTPVKLIQRRSA